MPTNLHQNSKCMRIAQTVSLDALTVIGIVALAHTIRQTTKNLLNEISSYSSFLAQAQTLLQDKSTDQKVVEQTLQTVYALTQKTMILNYLILPFGVAIIFCGLQAILYKKVYNISYKQFFKYSLWFVLASYFFVYTSINVAMTLVYQEPNQFLLWILSILLLIIISFTTFQKIIEPKNTIRYNKKLFWYHFIFLFCATIMFFGAVLTYLFLQTQQSVLLPIGITFLGLILLAISRDRYIKESTKTFKEQRRH